VLYCARNSVQNQKGTEGSALAECAPEADMTSKNVHFSDVRQRQRHSRPNFSPLSARVSVFFNHLLSASAGGAAQAARHQDKLSYNKLPEERAQFYPNGRQMLTCLGLALHYTEYLLSDILDRYDLILRLGFVLNQSRTCVSRSAEFYRFAAQCGLNE
jgi:hypothetical protein